MGVLAVAAVLFLIWKQRNKKSKQAKIKARNDAKVKAAAGEKFRPGQQKRGAGANSVLSDDRSTRTGTAASRAQEEAELEEVDEEDIEYTELRPDGLTTFKKEEDEHDTLGALVGLGVNRRYSTSAATHLSRISEGQEVEDDDDQTVDGRSIRAGSTRTGRTSIRRKLFNANQSQASLRAPPSIASHSSTRGSLVRAH